MNFYKNNNVDFDQLNFQMQAIKLREKKLKGNPSRSSLNLVHPIICRPFLSLVNLLLINGPSTST